MMNICAKFHWNQSANTEISRHVQFFSNLATTLTLISDLENLQQCIQMMNIYAIFHWNPSTECGDIASRGQTSDWRNDGMTDGQPENIMQLRLY